jgi:putative DNA primase/helicase
MAIDRIPIRDRTRGLWRLILPSFGITSRYLTGKNGPCPMCGGKDRWRFLDTNGDGTWICNNCGGDSGTVLLMKYLGMPFRDLAPQIEALIGIEQPRPVLPKRDDRRIRASLNAMWSEATPIRRGDPVDQWLRYRRVGLDVYPGSLRLAERLPYYDKPRISRWPAMLGLVSGPDGSPASIHRTYLTKQGFKAPVDSPRKLYSSIPKGSAIRLTLPAAILGIAEGIETALSTSKMFGVPTWSVLCAHGIETFEPPPQVSHLIIFADNDASGVGQKAAHTLAAQLADRIRVDVRIPEQPNTDWNDELIRGTA